MHNKVLERYEKITGILEGRVLKERIIAHFMIMVHLHTVILSFLKNDEPEKAFDILTQVGLRHLLFGLTPLDFRVKQH